MKLKPIESNPLMFTGKNRQCREVIPPYTLAKEEYLIVEGYLQCQRYTSNSCLSHGLSLGRLTCGTVAITRCGTVPTRSPILPLVPLRGAGWAPVIRQTRHGRASPALWVWKPEWAECSSTCPEQKAAVQRKVLSSIQGAGAAPCKPCRLSVQGRR